MQQNGRLAIVRLDPFEDEPGILMIEVVIGDETITIANDPTQERTASDHICNLATELIDAVLEEAK